MQVLFTSPNPITVMPKKVERIIGDGPFEPIMVAPFIPKVSQAIGTIDQPYLNFS
jgi:hypothetical protein